MDNIIINSSNSSKDTLDKDSVCDSDNNSFLKYFYFKIY